MSRLRRRPLRGDANIMSNFPIIFGLHDIVQGDEFLAAVAVQGRALLHEDEGEVWVEGINPGGFVATGSSVADALQDFRKAYSAILFDIAVDASSFEDFKDQVESFFNASTETSEREWENAVQDLREGRTSAEWLNRRSADSPRTIGVFRIDTPSAKENAVDEGAALAA
jgi:hypothetical protein